MKIDMKKYYFIAALLCGSVMIPALAETNTTVEIQQPQSPKKDKFSVIKFDTLRVNFGTFSEKDPVKKCSFKFTNTGTAPLVIHQALASCGCTVPSYSKTPVAPGQTGQIDVSYNGTGKFIGHFQKTITVRSNAENEVVRLTIEGTMTK